MLSRTTHRLLTAALASLLCGLAVGIWLSPVPGRAQGEALYFVSTGQRLANDQGFLDHWRTSNGPLTLGAPVTPPLEADGLIVQYFERGRLELHPEYGGAILRGRLGAEYAATLWKQFSPPPAGLAAPEGTRLFSETGYSLAEPFATFWDANGGVEVFGLPISTALWEYVGSQMALVQYFERARLEHYPAGTAATPSVQIATLGRDLALLRGLPTAPVDPAGATAVDASGQPLPAPAPVEPAVVAPVAPTAAPAPADPAPAPAPPPPAPTAAPAPVAAPVARSSGKTIVVDLSDQWLYAYASGEMVYDAPVSTGRDGFNTPVGRFAIYAKVRSQTMEGCAGDECWSVPNVPNAMYIVGGVALHGTYWHNQFGSGVRRSHGCVNLPLNAAAWLYDWAPNGTPVTVQW